MAPDATCQKNWKAGSENSRTAEPKLASQTGLYLTEMTTDQEGLPLRDHQSTSHAAGFVRQPISWCGCGMSLRRRVAAAWLWRRWATGRLGSREQGQVFPMALQILDLYYALEHLSTLTKLLDDEPETAKTLWRTWREHCWPTSWREVLSQARQQAAKLAGQTAELAHKEIGYFENNQSRMLYGTYRALGFFYGSGVVEVGCKTVIGARCKGSGMRWSDTRGHPDSGFALLPLWKSVRLGLGPLKPKRLPAPAPPRPCSHR